MNDKIIELKQYCKDLDQQINKLADYQNDGSIESMLTEGIVNLTQLIQSLFNIVQTQTETIEAMVKRIEKCEKELMND